MSTEQIAARLSSSSSSSSSSSDTSVGQRFQPHNRTLEVGSFFFEWVVDSVRAGGIFYLKF